jgi:hypothetical protein
MKTTLLCGILLIASVVHAAPGNRSRLEIVSHAVAISVSIDRQYFGQPGSYFSVDNIKPGNRYIEIFTPVQRMGYGSDLKRLFAGRVYIQPGVLVSAVFDPARGFVIQQTRPLAAGYQYYGSEQTYYTNPTEYAVPLAMSHAQFLSFLDVIDDQWSEENRIQVALQGLAYNYLSTAQVKEVMDEFWSEEGRLTFAKAAFTRVTDPQIYYEVYDEFWSASSVQELSRYILSLR